MKIESCTREQAKHIVNALNDYNLNIVPPVVSENWTPLEFIMKNEQNEILGGILSGIGYWGALEIKILWVQESYRKRGIGSLLLRTIEKEAKEKGATLSTVDTFDFQAEQFYFKNGYKEFGRLNNFPEGHQRIYFSKDLREI